MRNTGKKVLLILASAAVLLVLAGPVLPSVLAASAAQDWDEDMGRVLKVSRVDNTWTVEGTEHTVVMNNRHDLLEIEFKPELD